MLRVIGLGKRYASSPVFDSVSFEAMPGEVIAILGESGVGKSTLLNALAGLDAVDAGRVLLGDTEITAMDAHAQALWRREHVGFVFQAFHVLPHLTVAQNVGLPLMLLKAPSALREQRVQQALASVGLEGFDDRAPRTLSGGQLQRVAIARALVHQPALLLADEPTGNLDPETAYRIIELLMQQSRQHQAVGILVTHSQAAAERADRVLRLTRLGIA